MPAGALGIQGVLEERTDVARLFELSGLTLVAHPGSRHNLLEWRD